MTTQWAPLWVVPKTFPQIMTGFRCNESQVCSDLELNKEVEGSEPIQDYANGTESMSE